MFRSKYLNPILLFFGMGFCFSFGIFVGRLDLNTPIGKWVFDYQTLITGIIAVLAAFVAYQSSKQQIEVQIQIAKDRSTDAFVLSVNKLVEILNDYEFVNDQINSKSEDNFNQNGLKVSDYHYNRWHKREISTHLLFEMKPIDRSRVGFLLLQFEEMDQAIIDANSADSWYKFRIAVSQFQTNFFTTKDSIISLHKQLIGT